MTITMKPDRRLLRKQWLILLTISAFVLLTAVLLQLLLPLDEELTAAAVAEVLWLVTPGFILLMWLIAAPIFYLWIKNLGYEIHEDRITIRKGILTKMQQNIPMRMITDFVLHRSIYDRLLGIGSIRIQTAGQSHAPTGYEGNLAGLKDWESMHAELQSRLGSLRGKEEPESTDSEPPSDARVLHQMLDELKAIRRSLES